MQDLVPSACKNAETALSQCELQQCGSGCVLTGGDGAVPTNCTTPVACPEAGATVTEEYCVSGSSCYYQVGTQMIMCNSCSDTTACAQAAATACN
jgi:hypothetical protein